MCRIHAAGVWTFPQAMKALGTGTSFKEAQDLFSQIDVDGGLFDCAVLLGWLCSWVESDFISTKKGIDVNELFITIKKNLRKKVVVTGLWSSVQLAMNSCCFSNPEQTNPLPGEWSPRCPSGSCLCSLFSPTFKDWAEFWNMVSVRLRWRYCPPF